MPVRKHDDKKNAPVEKRDSAIVPPKEEASKQKPQSNTSKKKVSDTRVNALSTAGKKKKPK